MLRNAVTSRQLSGSEYGGVEHARATIQPSPPSTLTNAEKLRLGYLTGDEANAESIEDRRQFWGLRPAGGRRSYWVDGGDGPVASEATIEHVGEKSLQVDP